MEVMSSTASVRTRTCFSHCSLNKSILSWATLLLGLAARANAALITCNDPVAAIKPRLWYSPLSQHWARLILWITPTPPPTHPNSAFNHSDNRHWVCWGIDELKLMDVCFWGGTSVAITDLGDTESLGKVKRSRGSRIQEHWATDFSFVKDVISTFKSGKEVYCNGWEGQVPAGFRKLLWCRTSNKDYIYR